MLLYLAVIVGSWIGTRLPLRVAYTLARFVGVVAYFASRNARHNIQGNLSVVLGLPASGWEVRRTALRAFQNNSMNWIDTLRLGDTSSGDIEQRVTVDGWDRIEASLQQQSGLILIGMHLGNIDVVGQIIAARGYVMTVPVEPLRPKRLFERTQRLRQKMGINAVPAGIAARPMLAALKRGEIVGMMCDRNISDSGLEVEFFGRKTVVSRGPAWLARRSRAPAVVGFGVRRGAEGFRGYVQGPLSIPQTENEDADVQAIAQTIMAMAEDNIRRYPEQWAMFSPVWSQIPHKDAENGSKSAA